MSELDARDGLQALVAEGLVVDVGSAYRWAARWRAEAVLQVRDATALLAERMARLEPEPGGPPDIADPPAAAFQEFVVGPYRPPADKPWLVVLQCSVRRPFSSSPSHASLRRAIAAATGFDPGPERDRCPVHVVVLASRLGPVPYECEAVYPANVRSTGVKGFDEDTFRRYRPILADRLAAYLTAHRGHYRHAAAFGEGRYGEVMRDAAARSGTPLAVLPEPGGASVRRLGDRRPRTYWERYWIQLYDCIVEWLEPAARRAAARRLAALGVERG